MGIIFKTLSQDPMHLLKKLKENYGYTNDEIAQKLKIKTTELTEEYAQNNTTKLLDLFHKIWYPGIVQLPPTTFWLTPFYLRVEDIHNPYETYVINSKIDIIDKIIEESKQLEPHPKVYTPFDNYESFIRSSEEIAISCNYTETLLQNNSPKEIMDKIYAGEISMLDVNYQMLERKPSKGKSHGRTT